MRTVAEQRAAMTRRLRRTLKPNGPSMVAPGSWDSQWTILTQCRYGQYANELTRKPNIVARFADANKDKAGPGRLR